MTDAPSASDPVLRALVIEHNRDLAQLYSILLKVLGCETRIACSVASGLQAARAMRPDLVFCELRLPGERDGFDLARCLEADAELHGVPLIAIVEPDRQTDLERARDAGFYRAFARPFKFSEIQRVLQTLRGRATASPHQPHLPLPA